MTGRKKIGFHLLSTRCNPYLFLLYSVPQDSEPVLTYQWVPLSSGFQLIFSQKKKGRKLERARRVILRFLFPRHPICRNSAGWLFPLSQGFTSCHVALLTNSFLSSDSSNCSLSSQQKKVLKRPLCNKPGILHFPSQFCVLPIYCKQPLVTVLQACSSEHPICFLLES